MGWAATLKWTAIGVAGAYGLLVAAMYVFQGRLVFYPNAEDAGSPADLGLDFTDLRFGGPDGKRLHGWLVPAEEARGLVLFCHGNAGNITHRLETIRLLHGLGMDVLIFDYQGYGSSRGRPGEKQTARDARDAWDLAVGPLGREPDGIVVMGRSLGGAVAARLAGEVRPAGLVVESAFTSIPAMGKRLYPFLPLAGTLTRYRFDTLAAMGRVACPVLVAHSPEDELVPFDMGQTLYEAAPEPKRFLAMKGGHGPGFLETGKAYPQTLDAFLTQVLATP